MDHRFFVSVPRHFEGLILNELTALHCRNLKQSGTGFYFNGSLEEAYRVVIWSRLANRVLLPIAAAELYGSEELYQCALEQTWEDHLSKESTFVIDVASTKRGEKKTGLDHSRYAALKLKDAIVDRLRDKFGVRPSVDRENPDVRVHLAITSKGVQISIDLGGGSLHQRGYRQYAGQAPLKENLAAGLLIQSGWLSHDDSQNSDQRLLVDPMCGSGTLLIEGAMMAYNIAPGLYRDINKLAGWKLFPRKTCQRLLSEARAAVVEPGKDVCFYGFDKDAETLEMARKSFRFLGLESVASLKRLDIKDWAPSSFHFHSRFGLVVTNPPYGERLGSLPVVSELYRKLGIGLKHYFPGWEAAVFTSNSGLAHRLGMRSHQKHSFMNGPLFCELLRFHIPAQSEAGPELNRQQTPAWNPSEEMFYNRLAKNRKKMKKWLKREGISCYRLYDADMPEFNAAVDVYENHAVCFEYAAPKSINPDKAEKRRFEMLHVLPEFLGIDTDHLHYKVRQRQKGNQQYQRRASTDHKMIVNEGGHSFWVNLVDFLDSGLFLDSRTMRQILKEEARGADVLNLFCYTGSASVYAAGGGARSVTSVDLSARYLEWAEENMKLNGFTGRAFQYIPSDAFEFLKEEKKYYDLIFLDPPSFSNSKKFRGTFDIQRDHVPLISLAMSRLRSRGILYFMCNLRDFALNEDELKKRRILCEEITKQTIPLDFQRNRKIHRSFKLTWS